jgi:hypothetical protein
MAAEAGTPNRRGHPQPLLTRGGWKSRMAGVVGRATLGADGSRDTTGNYGAGAVGAPMAPGRVAHTVAAIPTEEAIG